MNTMTMRMCANKPLQVTFVQQLCSQPRAVPEGTSAEGT